MRLGYLSYSTAVRGIIYRVGICKANVVQRVVGRRGKVMDALAGLEAHTWGKEEGRDMLVMNTFILAIIIISVLT